MCMLLLIILRSQSHVFAGVQNAIFSSHNSKKKPSQQQKNRKSHTHILHGLMITVSSFNEDVAHRFIGLIYTTDQNYVKFSNFPWGEGDCHLHGFRRTLLFPFTKLASVFSGKRSPGCVSSGIELLILRRPNNITTISPLWIITKTFSSSQNFLVCFFFFF